MPLPYQRYNLIVLKPNIALTFFGCTGRLVHIHASMLTATITAAMDALAIAIAPSRLLNQFASLLGVGGGVDGGGGGGGGGGLGGGGLGGTLGGCGFGGGGGLAGGGGRGRAGGGGGEHEHRHTAEFEAMFDDTVVKWPGQSAGKLLGWLCTATAVHCVPLMSKLQPHGSVSLIEQSHTHSEVPTTGRHTPAQGCRALKKEGGSSADRTHCPLTCGPLLLHDEPGGTVQSHVQVDASPVTDVGNQLPGHSPSALFVHAPFGTPATISPHLELASAAQSQEHFFRSPRSNTCTHFPGHADKPANIAVLSNVDFSLHVPANCVISLPHMEPAGMLQSHTHELDEGSSSLGSTQDPAHADLPHAVTQSSAARCVHTDNCASQPQLLRGSTGGSPGAGQSHRQSTVSIPALDTYFGPTGT